MKANRREKLIVIVELNEQAVNKLLETTRIKVGWISNWVRRRAQFDQCFKCLGYGHQFRFCKEPDHSGLCYKSGMGGHRANTCTSEPHYVLCKGLTTKPENMNLKHIPGSGECFVFRRALE